METSADKTSESDVANPLRILSAYLTTVAMTRPPNAYKYMRARAEVKRITHLVALEYTHLKNNHDPGNCAVTLEEAVLANGFPVVAYYANETENDPEER